MRKMGDGELHEVISPEAIQILASYFGPGRQLRIPETTANAKSFEVLIGIPDTAAIVSAFGGCFIYLPGVPPRPRGRYGSDLPPSLKEVKRLSKTMSARQIAKRFGCSVRTIYNKRARIKALEAEGQSID